MHILYCTVLVSCIYLATIEIPSLCVVVFRERKITLKGKDSQELVALQRKAEGLHLPTYLVQDAGRTQVAPGSVTVLAIFGDDQAVDEVTGHLKLL